MWGGAEWGGPRRAGAKAPGTRAPRAERVALVRGGHNYSSNKEPRNVTKDERIEYLCHAYEMLRNGSISRTNYEALVALIMRGYAARSS
jgi:hypothetical protein